MDNGKTGEFIAKLRKEKGLTQAALAEMLNVSNRTVSKWENGDGMPDISILPELAKALGVTSDDILAGERPENGKSEIRVTEVENKENLDNFFSVCFVISVFLAVFSALLGTVTEIYSIWAFHILFYTHWEIIFAAAALVSSVLSGLVFSVGTVRLGLRYDKGEIKIKVSRKAWVLSLILSFFPAVFILRVFQYIFNYAFFWGFAIIILVVFAAVLFVLYRKVVSVNKKQRKGD